MPKKRKSVKTIPEGYSLYDSMFGQILRRKGGPSGTRIKKDPKYKGLRARNTEFGGVARSAVMLRNAVGPLLAKKEHSLVGRVNSLFLKIKELDTSSKPGNRHVGSGFGNPEAKKLISQFEFNDKTQLSKVYFGKLAIPNMRELSFNLNLPEDIKAPKNATHILFIANWIRLDFAKKEEIIREDSFQTTLEKKPLSFILRSGKSLPAGGTKFLVLSIQFIQEQNGRQYEMMQLKFRPVTILELF